MTIEELRKEIDRIDGEMIRLYGERMETARKIGQYKRENHLPVTDTQREREVLNRAGEKAGEEAVSAEMEEERIDEEMETAD